MEFCSIEGCDNPVKVKSRQLCNRHYRRFQRHGDPHSGGTPNGEPYRYFVEVVANYVGEVCLDWPYGKSGNGYPLMSKAGGKDRYVHRASCEVEHGPPPTPRHEAAHSCGRGHLGCVARKHLSWKTSSENQLDKRNHGTDNRGARHPLTKLTEAEVRRIRAYGPNVAPTRIAREFGVTYNVVYMIRNGVTWKHLK